MGTTTTAAITWREMLCADSEAVVSLERESFHDAWNQAMLNEEVANPLTTYIVMEKAGRIVGYAGFWMVAGEAQITRVAVTTTERGLGLGNLLTAELLRRAWSLGAEAVTLEVREHNQVAQKAYVKNGFQAVGVRPNYYEDTHEGAVIMWAYK